LHHPSALEMFEQIIDASKGKQIVMFLDYDGTLSPIVDDPDRAFMSKQMRATVRKLARFFPTAIVSGSKYKKGSEGVVFQAGSEFLPMIDEKWSGLAQVVKSVLKEYPKLRLTRFANCTDVFPVYIGDDRTDEDAFKVLRERGQGFGILVSKFPKDTSASYSLQEPTQVMDFLQRLVEWKRVAFQGHSRV
ncbi:TREHALOSE 6-PHOSPHATE PHOSPHATASE, partial [Salix viminalis]